MKRVIRWVLDFAFLTACAVGGFVFGTGITWLAIKAGLL